jgi:hypothetical protein
MDHVFSDVFWGVIISIAAYFLWGTIRETLTEVSTLAGEQVGYFAAFKHLEVNSDFWLIGQGIVLVIMVLFVLSELWDLLDCFYKAKWISTINLDTKTINEKTFNFPLRAGDEDTRFDRVTKINVQQSSLQKLLGIGSVVLTIIRNENFESKEMFVCIEFLTDPIGKKKQLSHLLSVDSTETMKVARS